MPISPDTEEPKKRAVMGSLYRDILESLRAAGLLESVRAAVGPTTVRLIDHPPWAFGWLEASELDDTVETLLRLHGKEKIVATGLAVARRQSGGLLKPLVRAMVGLTGSNPATIYANLDGLYNVTVRGISFEWQSEGAHGGTMLLRTGQPPPPTGILDFIEGTLHYGTELCNVSGVFKRHPGPAGYTCAWSIRWEPQDP